VRERCSTPLDQLEPGLGELREILHDLEVAGRAETWTYAPEARCDDAVRAELLASRLDVG
jgi:hypothetical protein